MIKYMTTQGDTWDMVALKTLGSEAYMDLVIKENPLHRETAIFSAGTELYIPAIATPKPNNLPPWKR